MHINLKNTHYFTDDEIKLLSEQDRSFLTRLDTSSLFAIVDFPARTKKLYTHYVESKDLSKLSNIITYLKLIH